MFFAKSVLREKCSSHIWCFVKSVIRKTCSSQKLLFAKNCSSQTLFFALQINDLSFKKTRLPALNELPWYYFLIYSFARAGGRAGGRTHGRTGGRANGRTSTSKEKPITNCYNVEGAAHHDKNLLHIVSSIKLATCYSPDPARRVGVTDTWPFSQKKVKWMETGNWKLENGNWKLEYRN